MPSAISGKRRRRNSFQETISGWTIPGTFPLFPPCREPRVTRGVTCVPHLYLGRGPREGPPRQWRANIYSERGISSADLTFLFCSNRFRCPSNSTVQMFQTFALQQAVSFDSPERSRTRVPCGEMISASSKTLPSQMTIQPSTVYRKMADSSKLARIRGIKMRENRKDTLAVVKGFPRKRVVCQVRNHA